MKLSSQAPLEDLSTFSLDSTAGGTSGQIKAAGFNIATANISFNLVNPTLDDAVYVTHLHRLHRWSLQHLCADGLQL